MASSCLTPTLVPRNHGAPASAMRDQLRERSFSCDLRLDELREAAIDLCGSWRERAREAGRARLGRVVLEARGDAPEQRGAEPPGELANEWQPVAQPRVRVGKLL